jgi:hypothetical protein
MPENEISVPVKKYFKAKLQIRKDQLLGANAIKYCGNLPR